MKTRTFSIYLLKSGVTDANALEPGHGLDGGFAATALPQGAKLWMLDGRPREPWWRSFFGITSAVQQQSKGALVLVPIGQRWFALSFGHVSHHLRDDAYEYDFGLRVTLNSVDRNALTSTDVLQPGSARRMRVQLPTASDLTLFDFDQNASVLRSITGKVRADRRRLFKHATGAANLRVSAKIEADALVSLLREQILLNC